MVVIIIVIIGIISILTWKQHDHKHAFSLQENQLAHERAVAANQLTTKKTFADILASLIRRIPDMIMKMFVN